MGRFCPPGSGSGYGSTDPIESGSNPTLLGKAWMNGGMWWLWLLPCMPVWQPPGLSGPAPGGACDGWRGRAAPLRPQLVSPPRRAVFCTLPSESSASQNTVSKIANKSISQKIGAGSNWICRSGFSFGHAKITAKKKKVEKFYVFTFLVLEVLFGGSFCSLYVLRGGKRMNTAIIDLTNVKFFQL